VFTKLPPDRVTRREKVQYLGSGFTLDPGTNQVFALDAATGRIKWKFTSPSGSYSGLLSTEGGLVLGASGGVCFAVDAETGREVWRVSLGGDTKAAPISFMVDGRQVIAVAAGHALFVFEL
jgi:alcohol dehydrogenase (cytochrome c)